MALTIRYPTKNTGLFVKYEIEKLSHMLPWMTTISSSERPTERNTSIMTSTTNSADSALTITLSVENDSFRSREAVALPVT